MYHPNNSFSLSLHFPRQAIRALPSSLIFRDSRTHILLSALHSLFLSFYRIRQTYNLLYALDDLLAHYSKNLLFAPYFPFHHTHILPPCYLPENKLSSLLDSRNSSGYVTFPQLQNAHQVQV